MTASHAVRGDATPSKPDIAAIARLEHEALYRRNATERVSDAIVKFCGRVRFLLIQAVWICINLNFLAGVRPFDPVSFGVLARSVSGEADCALLALRMGRGYDLELFDARNSRLSM